MTRSELARLIRDTVDATWFERQMVAALNSLPSVTSPEERTATAIRFAFNALANELDPGAPGPGEPPGPPDLRVVR